MEGGIRTEIIEIDSAIIIITIIKRNFMKIRVSHHTFQALAVLRI